MFHGNSICCCYYLLPGLVITIWRIPWGSLQCLTVCVCGKSWETEGCLAGTLLWCYLFIGVESVVAMFMVRMSAIRLMLSAVVRRLVWVPLGAESLSVESSWPPHKGTVKIWVWCKSLLKISTPFCLLNVLFAAYVHCIAVHLECHGSFTTILFGISETRKARSRGCHSSWPKFRFDSSPPAC